MLDSNQCMTRKEKKETGKELGHAVLVKRGKKKDHILEFFRVQGKYEIHSENPGK